MERLRGNLPYTIIILDHFKTRLGCCILTRLKLDISFKIACLDEFPALDIVEVFTDSPQPDCFFGSTVCIDEIILEIVSDTVLNHGCIYACSPRANRFCQQVK
ncbi:UNVERIFIED_CONTAM: hypothetical protein ABID98_005099 [Brevibacillus sp. OAP136]